MIENRLSQNTTLDEPFKFFTVTMKSLTTGVYRSSVYSCGSMGLSPPVFLSSSQTDNLQLFACFILAS